MRRLLLEIGVGVLIAVVPPAGAVTAIFDRGHHHHAVHQAAPAGVVIPAPQAVDPVPGCVTEIPAPNPAVFDGIYGADRVLRFDLQLCMLLNPATPAAACVTSAETAIRVDDDAAPNVARMKQTLRACWTWPTPRWLATA